VWQAIKTFLVGVRWPETVAAIALLIQAAILGLHWRILTRHGETMEQQAKTGELIGQALDQQGRVLAEQAKIMDDQFKFQRKIEAKIERQKIFEVVLDLQARFVDLKTELSAALPSGTSVLDIAKQQSVDHKWSRLEEAIFPCEKALITAIHLSQAEKNYFMQYAQSVDAVTQKRSQMAVEQSMQLQAISDTYKDFTKRLMETALPPI
jgi:hypothetical protein